VAVFLFISFEIKVHKEISPVKVKSHKTNSSAVEVLTTDLRKLKVEYTSTVQKELGKFKTDIKCNGLDLKLKCP